MKLLILSTCVFLNFVLHGQMCPGGGVNFSTAVTFDPAWIYGCNTGTSCNGGVSFDNRTICLPSVLLDPCAPFPSCGGIIPKASNVWFKFFASGTSAKISCFQNTSFVIGIQALSGGPSCGSLTEIGCAVAGGPSSGVVLSLTGLIPGKMYYFRIYGNAGPLPQRTGLYCFCGTTGLSNFVLPIKATTLKANFLNEHIQLNWRFEPDNNYAFCEIENSTNGITFKTIARIETTKKNIDLTDYIFTDKHATTNIINYYRIKYVSTDNKHGYSNIISIKPKKNNNFIDITNVTNKHIKINSIKKSVISIYNLVGNLIKTIPVAAGENVFSTSNMHAGTYLLHTKEDNTVKRFYVFN